MIMCVDDYLDKYERGRSTHLFSESHSHVCSDRSSLGAEERSSVFNDCTSRRFIEDFVSCSLVWEMGWKRGCDEDEEGDRGGVEKVE